MTHVGHTSGKVLLTALALVFLATSLDAQRSQPTSKGEARQSKLTAKQIENMEARIEVATAIVNRLQSEAKALGRANGWRQASLDSLLALPLNQLQRVQQEAFNVDSLQRSISEAKADPQLLGDPDEDLVYTPLPPCRYIDTRIVAGRFTGFRSYDLANAGTTYGGDATCSPTANFGVGEEDIGALAMNLTIINPAIAPGFAAAKPTQGAPLSSLVNWYETGEFVQAANMAIVPLDQTAAAPEFVLQTSADVHAIVDILGAFLAPTASALEVTSVETGWNLILQLQFDVVATCPVGYSVTGGGYNAITGLGLVVPIQFSKDGVNNAFRCRGISITALPITASGNCQAICARTPGR